MRYHFDIRDRGDLIVDTEGSEFPDIAAARQDAIMAARELMAEALVTGRPVDHRSFEIRDPERRLIETLAFKDAIPSG